MSIPLPPVTLRERVGYFLGSELTINPDIMNIGNVKMPSFTLKTQMRFYFMIFTVFRMPLFVLTVTMYIPLSNDAMDIGLTPAWM